MSSSHPPPDVLRSMPPAVPPPASAGLELRTRAALRQYADAPEPGPWARSLAGLLSEWLTGPDGPTG